jgi:Mn-containing catalase
MFISINKLANQLPKDKPDNRANALQEGLGGQFGEMRTTCHQNNCGVLFFQMGSSQRIYQTSHLV